MEVAELEEAEFAYLLATLSAPGFRLPQDGIEASPKSGRRKESI
jgi:hypothetical protein